MVEPLGAIIWLLVFGLGVACAARFVRVAKSYYALGAGLAAVVVLFVLTYLQPPMLWRLGLLLIIALGTMFAFRYPFLRRGSAESAKPA